MRVEICASDTKAVPSGDQTDSSGIQTGFAL